MILLYNFVKHKRQEIASEKGTIGLLKSWQSTDKDVLLRDKKSNKHSYIWEKKSRVE